MNEFHEMICITGKPFSFSDFSLISDPSPEKKNSKNEEELIKLRYQKRIKNKGT